MPEQDRNKKDQFSCEHPKIVSHKKSIRLSMLKACVEPFHPAIDAQCNAMGIET